MEIKQISVFNLFELFNHVIPLKSQEHVTIIYGPNGYGKTIMLKMLNRLFTRGYALFRTIPFSEFSVEFSDGRTVKVTRDMKKAAKQNSYPQFEHTDVNGKTETWEPSRRRPSTPSSMREIIDLAEEMPDLDRVGARSWSYLPTGEILGPEELIDRFEDFQPSTTRAMRQPEWLTKIQNSISIRFLDVERLLGTVRRRSPYEEQPQRGPAITQYSRELANLIQKTFNEYGVLSQQLDRSFPRRLLEKAKPAKIASTELRRKLYELETKGKQLVDAGVLDRVAIEERITGQIGQLDRNVLSVYLADMEQKLRVFDDLAKKLDVMKTIINSRFSNKQMTIDRKEGFILTSSNGKKLRPNALSSGEQHEVVMLYELLFRIKKNTLFLIDEPELSLHVGWQMQLVSDLQGIAELGSFHVLMATHSPQIINKRWDLTVELKGPNE